MISKKLTKDTVLTPDNEFILGMIVAVVSIIIDRMNVDEKRNLVKFMQKYCRLYKNKESK